MKEGQNPLEIRPPQASLKDASDKARSFFSELLREKTEKNQKPPLQPGEVFTPEEEIKKIKTLPKKDRGPAVEIIKEKLAYQKAGLAKIQEALVKAIRANPDTTYAQLFEQAKNLGARYGLDWYQEELVRRMIRRYEEKHKAVQKIRKEYPGDNDLFEAVFGRQPKGRVEVVEGPMTLYFKIQNPEDYAYLFSHAFLDKREPAPEKIAEAQKTGGCFIDSSLLPELAGALIVENAVLSRPEGHSEQIRIHEEQHAITKLFKQENERLNGGYPVNEAYDAILAGGIKNLEENLRRYFTLIRRADVEDFIKNEILSFFKQGFSAPETIKNLTEKGGPYDALSKFESILSAPLIVELVKDHKPLIEKIAAEVFDRKKYAQSIKDAVAVFSALREKGYTMEQTIALLQPEPLFQWKKTYKRLTGESFQN